MPEVPNYRPDNYYGSPESGDSDYTAETGGMSDTGNTDDADADMLSSERPDGRSEAEFADADTDDSTGVTGSPEARDVPGVTADTAAEEPAPEPAEDVIFGNFKLPRIKVSPPVFRPGEQVGTPAEMRTPSGRLHRLAGDRQLAAVDRNIRTEAGKEGLTDQERREVDEKLEKATKAVLRVYGVDPGTVRSFKDAGNMFEFDHKGNTVRATLERDTIDVVAFDSRLTPAERARVEQENIELLKRGTGLMGLDARLQGDDVPPYMSAFGVTAGVARQEVATALNQHKERVTRHDVLNGFRSFRIATPGVLRLGLPMMMHLVEQPPRVAEHILGPHSPTEGFIQVQGRRPGVFEPAIPARPGSEVASFAWGILRNGTIARVAPEPQRSKSTK